jgi:hypothetical protein
MNRSQAAVTRALSASENPALGLSGLRMAHNRLSPVPRQQLVEPMSRMRGDAREDVGEPGLRVDAVHLGGDDEPVHVCSAPASAVGSADAAAWTAKQLDLETLVLHARAELPPIRARVAPHVLSLWKSEGDGGV